MAGHPGLALTAAEAVIAVAVAECRRCGTWLGDHGGEGLCEDCELSDCAFCGTAVPRMDLSAELACPMCMGDPS